MEWEKLLNPERIRSGTRYPGDSRDQVERDYGRVIFSTPFRRLQDKAQVFPLEPIDAVRTRLTHSMEVSAVSKGFATAVTRKLLNNEQIDNEQAYQIESIATTCGLLHDLGNPPFGHAGEDAIRNWFSNHFKKNDCDFWNKPDNKSFKDDLLLFEGNAQTLRLITKLQILSDEYGLNLTFAVLSACQKYLATSNQVDKKHERHSFHKLGFYQTEKEITEKIWAKTGTSGKRNPISLLVEAADDSVYAVVDIEDGIKKQVLDWGLVRDTLKEGLSPELFSDLVDTSEQRINSSRFTKGARNNGEFYSQYFRTLAIAQAHQSVSEQFSKNYDAIMNGDFDEEILFSGQSEIPHLYKTLKKQIGKPYVWSSKETLRLELLGKNVLHLLLDTFFDLNADENDTSSFQGKAYNLMSSNYRDVYDYERKQKNFPEKYLRALLVTDYISGMTDSFALNLHRELSLG